LSLRGQRIVKQRFAELTGIGYKNAYLFMLKTTNMIYADVKNIMNYDKSKNHATAVVSVTELYR